MSLDNKTGIFQTRDELKVRRVLSWAREAKLSPTFLYKDGWYEVWVLTSAVGTAGSYYARLAATIASTDLVASPLCEFTQEGL